MFYQKIVDYCNKNGLSIMAFEKKCHIGNGTVGKWKDDNSLPALTTIKKIADATKTPIEQWIKQERK